MNTHNDNRFGMKPTGSGKEILQSTIAQYKLFYRECHDVDDRRQLLADIARIEAELALTA